MRRRQIFSALPGSVGGVDYGEVAIFLANSEAEREGLWQGSHGFRQTGRWTAVIVFLYVPCFATTRRQHQLDEPPFSLVRGGLQLDGGV